MHNLTSSFLNLCGFLQGKKHDESKSTKKIRESFTLSFVIFLLYKPAGAIANTAATAAPTQEKQKSPATAPRGKARGKKGKGKGKTKPEVPEETDPRKLELIRWVSEIQRRG